MQLFRMEIVRAARHLPRARARAAYAANGAMISRAPPGCRSLTLSRTGRSGDGTGVSASRLEEFVRAEEHYFAQQRFTQAMEPLTFAQLVSASTSMESLEAMLRRELPVRFAARISHIKVLPEWEQIPELVELQRMHVQSFRELRLVELEENASFAEVVRNVRERHKAVVPLFAEAVSKMQDSHGFAIGQQASSSSPSSSSSSASSPYSSDRRMAVNSLDDWAEKLINSRISTEVLMTHYLVSRKATGPVDPTKIGILDTRCDPHDVCLSVAEKLKAGEYASCVIRVEEPSKKIQLCQSPRYLFYLVQELLLNACKATFKECLGIGAAFEAHPISVTVCADNHHVVIRISDKGGGMPFEDAENMWSFSHSSQRLYESSMSEPGLDTPAGQTSLTSLSSEADLFAAVPDTESTPLATRRPWGVGVGVSPMSGRGIGLPTCMCYARYLGGSLNIMNLPGQGVDAYLALRRIETF